MPAFLADAMIYDLIAIDRELMAELDRQRGTGGAELVSTRVLEDQLAAIPDEEKRGLVARVPRTEIGAGVFVVGYGRLDVDRLGPSEPYESVSGANRKHVVDAILAATAGVDGLTLVTHDRRLVNQATGHGIETIDFAGFRQRVLGAAKRSGRPLAS